MTVEKSGYFNPDSTFSDLFLFYPNNRICGHLSCQLVICGFMLTSDLRDNLRFRLPWVHEYNGLQ